MRGQLGNLHLIVRKTNEIRQLSDIICLTETGHRLTNTTLSHLALPGFKCIYAEPRPYLSECGGVAVYARARFAPFLTVHKDFPELGMVWLRLENPLGGRDTYICVLYLPHQTSKYYKRENGRLNS